jgi:hypothetical protein|nr:hypothetical protein [uncultured Dongia sp.]
MDFLGEVHKQINSGNNVVTAFTAGILVWWLANVMPMDLSLRQDGTTDERLDLLVVRAEKAERECQRSFDLFSQPTQISKCRPSAVDKLEGNLSSEWPGSPAATAKGAAIGINAGMKGENLGYSIERIDDELASIEAGDDDVCQKSAKDWRERHLARCLVLRSELQKEAGAITQEGDLDIAGLRIRDIHPKWHPLVLVLIVLAASAWLGSIRRRTLWFIDRHLNATPSIASPSDHFLSIPWWLFPMPRWNYGADQRSFASLVATKAECSRQRYKALGILLVLLVMLVTAFVRQQQVTKNELSESQRSLALLDNASFSLVGDKALDLAILAALFSIAIVVFVFVPPIPASQTQVPGQRRDFSRRALLRSILSGIGGIATAAVLAPLVMDLEATLGYARQKWDLLSKGKPRFRRPVQVAQLDLQSGWYQLISEKPMEPLRPHVGAMHFVRPPYQTKHGKRISKRPAGTIGGAASLADRKASLQSVPPAILISALESKYLKNRFYSEGVEFAALNLWVSGSREDAVSVLWSALELAKKRERLNVRIYDLLARLLALTGDEQGLRKLADDLKSYIDRPSKKPNNSALLEKRLDRWLAANGPWRNRWLGKNKRSSWNGIDL